jgi:hypothetical protein
MNDRDIEYIQNRLGDPGGLPGESDPSGPEANKAAGEWG